MKIAPPLNRSVFLQTTGKTFLASTFITPLLLAEKKLPHQNQNFNNKKLHDSIPIKLPPLNHPSEITEPQPPNAWEPAKRKGYAIVGLGHLALNNILPAFARCKYSKPVALVSGDAQKAAAVAAQYGIKPSSIYNYSNFDSIINNKEIDAVYIVLPNSMHEEFTIRAAKAGKHILCEKPMTVSSASAQKMIDACDKANKKLMVAYRIQYEPHHHLLKQWVREKKFGKARLIEMFNGQNIGDITQWRLHKQLSGGGSLPDIGLYCLNTARYLTGEEPEWINATMYSTPNDIRFKEVEETMLFQMRFPSGIIASCGSSYGVHECRKYTCMADNGAWFGLKPAFSYTGLKIEMSQAEKDLEWQHVPVVEEKDQFALEIDHFSICMEENKKPFTPGEEGLQDQKMMEAIYQSAKEGKPVTLNALKTLDSFRGTEPDYK